MAKKALIAKANRKPKHAVRTYTRCSRCGRLRGCWTSRPEARPWPEGPNANLAWKHPAAPPLILRRPAHAPGQVPRQPP